MNFDRVRSEVVSTCLSLADKGYLAGTGGNVACRIDDEHFAVTPSATDYYAMRPEDICVLRLDNLVQVAGNHRPSVEHRLHANVLRLRRDCDASIHTHQPIASAYTLLGRELEIQDPRHWAFLGSTAAFVSYAPSGTTWLASKLRKKIRPDINAYLLQNHGVVCCGPTLDETVKMGEVLETACIAFFHDAISTHISAGCEPASSKVLTLLLAATPEMEHVQ
jgi:L-fuculose-phosphate aldolase